MKYFVNIKWRVAISKFTIFFIVLILTHNCLVAQKSSEKSKNKFEPQNGFIYHGAQAEVRPLLKGLKYKVDWRGLDEYSQAVGFHPYMVMHYLSLTPNLLAIFKPAIREIAQQPYSYAAQIGLDFYDWPIRNVMKNRHDITCDIQLGKYDYVVENLALFFKELKIPIFLRPGYEFGGSGFGKEYDRKCYPEAWRHIVEIFRQNNVDNVAFVWHTLNEEDYMEYYPGDEFVDWWGISIFDINSNTISFIKQFLRSARTHNKPVMIAESTPRQLGTVKDTLSFQGWFKPYFKIILANPEIKAFCYINASWADYPDPSFQRDCRIQNSKLVLEQYREFLKNPRILHAHLKETQ